MGYSREDRAEYFRVYRTGESDHRIVRRRCGQFFGEAKIFQPLVIGTDIWKGFGYNTVVYLAAILGEWMDVIV